MFQFYWMSPKEIIHMLTRVMIGSALISKFLEEINQAI